jgi:uncharacterized membrane protein
MKSTQPSFPDDLDTDPGDGLARLIGLSDAIYAFAMTLLAVNIDFPQIAASADAEQVTTAVVDLLPQLFIYVTSFILVAMYWQISRRVFRLIERDDQILSWLTLLQLMCVAFIPVATGLFDTHPTVSIVVVVYAGTLWVIGIIMQVLWRHARNAKLLREDVPPMLVDYYDFRGNVTIVVYTLVLLAGLVAPTYARAILLLLLTYPFMQSIYRFWRSRRPQS